MSLQPQTAPGASVARLGYILNDGNRFDLCAALTALLLLLYPPEGWYAEIPLSLIAIAGIVFSDLRKNAIFWGTATLVVALGVSWKWYIADNHKYLLVCWCLAIFLSLITNQPERALKTAARWLVALVFVFAVVQKTRSQDYLNGAFFYSELLLDDRFEALARFLGGVTAEMKNANHANADALRNFDSSLSSVQLQATTATSALVNFITWWNYSIQIAIAVLFVVPWR